MNTPVRGAVEITRGADRFAVTAMVPESTLVAVIDGAVNAFMRQGFAPSHPCSCMSCKQSDPVVPPCCPKVLVKGCS